MRKRKQFARPNGAGKSRVARVPRRRLDAVPTAFHRHVQPLERHLVSRAKGAAVRRPVVGLVLQMVTNVQYAQRQPVAGQHQRVQQYAGIQAAAEGDRDLLGVFRQAPGRNSLGYPTVLYSPKAIQRL